MASVVSKDRSFNGWQYVYEHSSKSLGCQMKFGIYVPDHAESEKLCTLFYLSGLTCTHANFMEKSGFQRFASMHRMIVVHPDTSPRGVDIEGDSDSWDFGKGAGFYVNATEPKWAENYNMYDYISKEMPEVVKELNCGVDESKMGIFGHSMGGHGAIVIGLRNPEVFKSISAFAPIANPMNVPWGKKAFSGYLGTDESKWKLYDSSELIKEYKGENREILVDQGGADNFLENQLKPNALKSTENVTVKLRIQADFNHSYYFIASFIQDHFEHHLKLLKD